MRIDWNDKWIPLGCGVWCRYGVGENGQLYKLTWNLTHLKCKASPYIFKIEKIIQSSVSEMIPTFPPFHPCRLPP